MNIEDWDIFLKYKNKNQMLSNSVYVPYVNKEKTVFCMDYNYNSKYFFDRPDYTQSKMDFYFQNEIKFLKIPLLLENQQWVIFLDLNYILL